MKMHKMALVEQPGARESGEAGDGGICANLIIKIVRKKVNLKQNFK